MRGRRPDLRSEHSHVNEALCSGLRSGLLYRSYANRHPRTAEWFSLSEDESAAEGERAFDEQQGFESFNTRGEVGATQKP